VAAPGISPHGFLTFAGLCANLGKPLADDPKNTPALDREAAITALEAMRELQSLMPPNMEKCNSIQMHELMVQGDEIVYCPSVFGFATYGETDQRRRLAFSGFAGLKKPFHAGSIIGGVGLAVSNVSTKTEEALSFIEFALDTRTQNKHFASNHGQPALITSWENPTIDKRFNGFFSSVRETIEAAEIRPRFPGYIRCQAEAGEIVEVYLRDGTPAALTVDAISRILESGAQRRSM
jgi:multiple sugar transport system substrate-binding protein